MLDIVKMKPVVDIHDLVDAMGEIEGLNRHDIFSEFQDMHCYGGGNESYIEVSDDWIADCLYESASEYLGDDWENISDEELLAHSSQSTPNEKVRHRLFEMMVKEDLPKEFVIHLWW